MGCGCNKKRSSVVAPPTERAASTAAQEQSAQVMFDVFKSDGSLVASYSNLVSARAESRRVGGNVVPRTKTHDGTSVATLTK